MKLSDFTKKHGVEFTAKLWGVSIQSVYQALRKGRDINIELVLDGKKEKVYEITETKLLRRGYVKT